MAVITEEEAEEEEDGEGDGAIGAKGADEDSDEVGEDTTIRGADSMTV
jgi:hypothetical protein